MDKKVTKESIDYIQTIDLNSSVPKNDINKKAKSLPIEISESIKEIVSISSVHGVPNLIATKRSIIRYLWIFFILCSSGVCSYFVSKTIMDYLNYDVVSLIDVINEQYSEFPTVSICTTTGGYDFDLESSIISCSFNNDVSCKKEPNNYFEQFLDPLYGLCFRFNSGKNILGDKIDILNSTFGGIQFGFLLDLKVAKPDYLDYSQLIVGIHNRTMSLASLYNEELLLSPGSRNYVLVKRTFNQKLELPYNDCYKNMSLFDQNKTIINYISNSSKSYSQKECLRICINLKYLEESKCECSGEWNAVEFLCLYRMINANKTIFNCTWNYYKEALKKTFDICNEYCPLECDSITYSLSFSSIYDYPSTGEIYNSRLSNYFANYSEVKTSFYSLQIFYEDLNYQLITQQPKVLLSDLIPNIGGILGLFLGTSFLSFAEVLECFLEIFFVILDHKIKKTNAIDSI